MRTSVYNALGAAAVSATDPLVPEAATELAATQLSIINWMKHPDEGELPADLSSCNDYFADRPPESKIQAIIIHATSGFGLDPVPDDPFAPKELVKIFNDIKLANDIGLAAHYLIARDGKVYQLVEDSKNAQHAGGGKFPSGPAKGSTNVNGDSIGIELAGVGDSYEMKTLIGMSYARYASAVWDEYKESLKYTEEQYSSLNKLLDKLCNAHEGIKKKDADYIFGHWEVDQHEVTDELWKTDPFKRFDWTKIGLPEKKDPPVKS